MTAVAITTTVVARATAAGATDPMPFGNSRMRLLFGGAAFAAMALVGVGCTSSPSNVAANNAASGSTGLVATTVPATTIVTTINAQDVLTKSIAGLANGYHFTSTFVVNGAQTLVADGDRIGAASRLKITQAGATVSYVVLPTASYAQPDGGDWQQLDTPPATTDPIASLNTPSAIGVLKDDGTKIRLRVTVSAATLGVATTGNADLEVVVTNGILTEVDYGTAVNGGGVASVATVIGPLADATPIAAPI